MKIPARRGHRSVTQCGLYQVNWRAPVERMRSVRVPEPVRAHAGGDPRPDAGLPHDPCDPRAFQRLAGPRREHRRVQAHCALQGGELAPHANRQENDARATAFAVSQDLPGVPAGLLGSWFRYGGTRSQERKVRHANPCCKDAECYDPPFRFPFSGVVDEPPAQNPVVNKLGNEIGT